MSLIMRVERSFCGILPREARPPCSGAAYRFETRFWKAVKARDEKSEEMARLPNTGRPPKKRATSAAELGLAPKASISLSISSFRREYCTQPEGSSASVRSESSSSTAARSASRASSSSRLTIENSFENLHGGRVVGSEGQLDHALPYGGFSLMGKKTVPVARVPHKKTRGLAEVDEKRVAMVPTLYRVRVQAYGKMSRTPLGPGILLRVPHGSPAEGDDVDICGRTATKFLHILDEAAIYPLEALDYTRSSEFPPVLEKAGEKRSPLRTRAVVGDEIASRSKVGRDRRASGGTRAREWRQYS